MRQPRLLPESLEPDDVTAFLANLRTFRDRAITLAMLLGGLRAAEVRSLRLAEVDMGMRRLRVTGKGGKERVVPADGAFFAELAAYLRNERPAGCRTPECFVVLRGPTAGQPLTEARHVSSLAQRVNDLSESPAPNGARLGDWLSQIEAEIARLGGQIDDLADRPGRA